MHTFGLFPPDKQSVWAAVVPVGLIVFCLSYFCLLLAANTLSLSPLWFSTATIIAALFHSSYRYWPMMLLVSGLMVALANALTVPDLIQNLPMIAVTLVEAALGAWLLRRLLDQHDPLNSIYAWLTFFLIGVLLIPALGALSAGMLFSSRLDSYSHFIARWYLAEAIGILAVTPVGLLLRSRISTVSGLWGDYRGMLIMGLVTLLLSVAALKYLPFPFTFVILPLLFGAIKLPRLQAFSLCMLTTIGMYIILTTGLIVPDIAYTSDPGILLPVPLLMVLIPAHAMAMIIHALREEHHHILESETRFRMAMQYSAIGMALVGLDGRWIQVNKALCRLLGYNEDELKQTSFQHITHPDDLNNDLTHLQQLLDGTIESYMLEKRYIRHDGAIVWALLAVSLVRDRENAPLYFISQVEDITEVKRSQSINQELVERITLANEAGGVGIWEWNIVTNELTWDKRMAEMYDLPDGVKPHYDLWLSRILPEDRPATREALRQAVDFQQPYILEFRILNRHNQISHLHAQAKLMKNKHGQVTRMLGINVDITRMASLSEDLQREKERLHITLDSINDAVIAIDQEMRVNFINPVAEKMTGWDQEHARGQLIDDILHITSGQNGPLLSSSLQCSVLAQRDAANIDHALVLHNRSGQSFDIQHISSPLKTTQGETIGAVVVIKDISEQRRLMQQLRYNAMHDSLTHLPNRSHFASRLQLARQSAQDGLARHALIFLDLDQFKAINDSAGHAAGDALLLELASKMQQQVRREDIVARLGGDEFGIILHDCDLVDARQLVQLLVDTINHYRFNWAGVFYRIGASAGITTITQANNDSNELMLQADLACYQAKHQGRGQVCVYQPDTGAT